METIIYPRQPNHCPTYLRCGGDEWRNDVRIANHFGTQFDYNIGDEVETISFYFADSESYKQNQVLIERGILEDIKKFKTHTSHHVKCRSCIKITTPTHMRHLRASDPLKPCQYIMWVLKGVPPFI